MARVTVEDCIEEIKDRYELVVLAAERAKNINAGAQIAVQKDNDKNTVIALREIAAGNINIDDLRNLVIQRLQKHNRIDHTEEDNESDAAEEDFGYISNGSEFLTDENHENFEDISVFEDITDPTEDNK
jgi:DNA-directed RNA polymerase subunit omega